MSALKTGLTVALAALFSIACASAPETTNQNRNSASPPPSATAQPANANTSGPGAVATLPAATANANQASPAAAYGKIEEAKNEAAKTGSKIDAASLYVAQKCIGCHGPDGKGKVKGVPDFTDAAWQKKESDADLISQIKKGEPPKMPSYKDKLNDAEIKALVAYIRAFAK